MRYRAEADSLDVGQSAADEIGGLVFEFMEFPDRHGGVAANGGFHIEPVPAPSHAQMVDGGDTGNRLDHLLSLVD